MRILFSSETYGCDPWILTAYKHFYEYMTKNVDCEVFGTLECIGGQEEVDQYNIICYSKFSKYMLNFISKDDVKILYPKLLEKARQYYAYTQPESIVVGHFRFKMILGLLQPDVVVLWNGMNDIRAMTRDILIQYKIPFLYAEKGMLPESWYIDETGINANCSLNKSSLNLDIKQEEKNQINEYIENIISKGSSAWEQPDRVGSELKNKLEIEHYENVIFFPGQVDNDTNITLYSSFKSIAQAAQMVLDALPEKTVLLIKPHPKSSDDSKQALNALSDKYSNCRVINDANVWDLIEISNLVISINSTVAFEALLKMKKVIMLGEGVLTKVELLRSANLQDLKSQIKATISMTFNEHIVYSQLQTFLYYLLHEYYIFRNRSFPESQISKIRNKCVSPRDKLFTREELWAFLYKEEKHNYVKLFGRKKTIKDLLFSSFRK